MKNKEIPKDDQLLELLKESGLFQAFLDSLPIMIFIKDAESRFVLVNKATAAFVGVGTPAEMIGKTDSDFYPEERATLFLKDEQQIIRTGKPLIEKFEPNIDASGRERLINVTKIPIRNDAGEIVGLLEFGVDDTERLVAERKLMEERNSLRTLIDALPDYIYVKDVNSRFLVANKTLAKHMGLQSTDDLIGKTDFDFYAKDVAASFFADEQTIIKTGVPVILKDEINCSAHGHTARVLTTKIPLKDFHGNITAIVGVGHDISTISSMERDLSQTNAELVKTLDELKRTQEQVVRSERLRALGQMASGIAHDFNNALMPIVGYADLLLNNQDILGNSTQAREIIQIILTASQDAAQTVRRLREFYNPRKLTEYARVSFADLIESTVSITRPMWKEQAAAKGIDINVVVDIDKSGFLYANESQMREILTNLIFNSVDALPEGGQITIRARRGERCAIMEVIDTGHEMAREAKDRCFEPFFTTKNQRGSGLGLSIVYGIVRRHEGVVTVDSEEGKGTTVRIEIPDRDVPLAEAGIEPMPETRTLKPMTVLVADDEDTVRVAIEACLKSDKHIVYSVTSGAEAVELLRKEKIDLVITDRAMPGMSGDVLASMVREINPKVPVIMLTGFGNMTADGQQHPAGVDLIISKPLTRQHLREAMSKVFAARQIPAS